MRLRRFWEVVNAAERFEQGEGEQTERIQRLERFAGSLREICQILPRLLNAAELPRPLSFVDVC